MISLNVKMGTCEQNDGTGTSNSSCLKNGYQCVNYRFITNLEKDVPKICQCVLSLAVSCSKFVITWIRTKRKSSRDWNKGSEVVTCN